MTTTVNASVSGGGGGELVDGAYGSITVSDDGASLDITDGVYGDITVSGSGATWTYTGGSTYLGPMTWAALQASSYANGSVGLAALDADASVLITGFQAGAVTMVPSADKTYWQGVNGFFPLAKAGLTTLNSITGPNVVTWTLAANPANGKTRITASGAHGITSAVNGKCLNVTAWSGTGAPTGLYELTYVDATNIDLTIAYGAGYGNPTISALAAEVQILAVTVPAALMQASSQIKITSVWKMANSANNRYAVIRLAASGSGSSGTAYLFLTPSSVDGLHDMRLISNINSKSSQVGQKSDSSIFVGGTRATSTVNTASAFDVWFGARCYTVDEFMELQHYTVEICV